MHRNRPQGPQVQVCVQRDYAKSGASPSGGEFRGEVIGRGMACRSFYKENNHNTEEAERPVTEMLPFLTVLFVNYTLLFVT